MNYINLKKYLLVICIVSSVSTKAHAAPNVVVTIKPLHSIVAFIMDDAKKDNGTNKPKLLLNNQSSPHHYSLRPSEIKTLNQADLIFWVGPNLESFLRNSLNNIKSKNKYTNKPKTKIIQLMNTNDLKLLRYRTHFDFDINQGHKHSHKHNHTGIDPHFWLDPIQVKNIIPTIVNNLSNIDPINANLYKKNADILIKKLINLDNKLQANFTNNLKHNKSAFMVYHDGFQYLEARYKLNNKGAISINPEIPLSAKRVNYVQKKLHKANVVCVFSEPQFNTKILNSILPKNINTAVLDPLGSKVKPGKDAYFEIMDNIVDSFKTCLGK
jgi:zinc transport system substrate-binding protein